MQWNFFPECGPSLGGYDAAVFDGRFRKHVLTITLPNLEQAIEELGGDAHTTMSEFKISVRGKSKAGVALLRTPRRCSRDAGWKSVVTVRFEDGSKKRFEPSGIGVTADRRCLCRGPMADS